MGNEHTPLSDASYACSHHIFLFFITSTQAAACRLLMGTMLQGQFGDTRLACVGESVVAAFCQKVGLCQAPELEHIVADFTPQGEGLQGVVVLPLVVVGETGAVGPPRDAQAEAILRLVRLEVVLQIRQHPVHRVSVEQQEAVVVADGVEALQDGLSWEAAVAVALHKGVPGFLLASDVSLDFRPGAVTCTSRPARLRHEPLSLSACTKLCQPD